MSNEPLNLATDAADAEAVFLRQVRKDLDQSCAALDGYTLSRLNRIRHAALERKRQGRRSPLLLPFGGLAMASVLVFCVMLFNATPPEPRRLPVAAEQLEDIDLLSASEELEFYEDLEFYQWLAGHQ
ncbi:MAG: hypothetical protein LBE21_11130 [Pseudomonadales bacterium]|nr:hypothetical protein [Pseudomonadales bacterium]